MSTTMSPMSTTSECSDQEEVLNEKSREEQLSSALMEIKNVQFILTTALHSTENYEIIRKDLSQEKDEISKLPNVEYPMEIPKMHKNYLKKVFKIPSKKNTKLVGKELNNYLKTFLINVRNTDIIMPKSYNLNEYSYCDLLKFLKDYKDSYKLFENNIILHDSCLYGYILNKFYEAYQIKIQNDEKSESYSDILKKEFEISDRYARKLRWLGKLWSDHKKIGNLRIAFSSTKNNWTFFLNLNLQKNGSNKKT